MTGIGVVIPARNEERLIGSCLRSILRASNISGVRTRIVVVDDGSTDATASIADRLLASVDGGVLSVSGGNVGAARRAGVRELLACNNDFGWIATTDADTEVPRDWLAQQLAHCERGADGVAGLVNIESEDESLRKRFALSYAHGITTGGHSHVHGANLGFRVSSYLAVGGFAPVPCSEDRDLWRRLGVAGYQLIADTDSIVKTSARLRSRTEGGFASDLRALVSQPRLS